jgi:tetratricopeptide (TPR) repeat protein
MEPASGMNRHPDGPERSDTTPPTKTLTAPMKKALIYVLPAVIACSPGMALGKKTQKHTTVKKSASAPATKSDKVPAYMPQAETAMLSGNYRQLIEEASRMIIHEPANPQNYYTRAMAKSMGSDYAGSNDDLAAVVRLMEKQSVNGIRQDDVWMTVANNRFLLGDVDGGKEAIRKAAALGSTKAGTWLGLHGKDQAGDALSLFALAAKNKSADASYASALLSQAIKLKPDYADAYYERGLINATMNPAQAAADFSKAIALKPALAAAYSQRGLIKQLQGDVPGSLLDLASATRQDPGNPETLQSLALSQAMAGNHAEAILTCSKLIASKPENSSYYVLRATNKLKSGDRTGAIDDYRKAAGMGNENALQYLYDNGLEKPRNASDLFTTGVMLVNSTRDTDALTTFTKAVEADPSFAKAYYGRAKAKYLMDDLEGALADVRKAKELDPKVEEKYSDNRGLKPSLFMIYLGLGDKMKSAGRMQDAVAYYDMAIQQNPGYSESYYDRGLARWSMGKKNEAVEDMKKAALMGHQGAAAWMKQKR